MSGKLIAISQSNYIPWKGYFDMINLVDEFILYDDMQYTRRDWRNRNIVKTAQGQLWLTVPVEVKGKYNQKINETLVSNPGWALQHWKIIQNIFGKSRHFGTIAPLLEKWYTGAVPQHLSHINRELLELVMEHLGIRTKLSWSSDYSIVEGKNERLLDLVQQAGGDRYLSGPAAKDYLDESLFDAAGIQVIWMDYSGYPEYPQLYGPFVHGVSIIDLLFNCGPESHHFMKSFSSPTA